MRALAVVLACSVVGCADGVIRLTSGTETPDANVALLDASGVVEVDATGSPDGGEPSPEAAAPPADGSVNDAGQGCQLDTQCPLASLHCDLGSGTCVECTNDTQCTKPGYPRCDLASHRCVGCGVSADCPDGGVCEPTTLRCVVPCKGDGGCPNDDLTCSSQGYCVSCEGKGDGGIDGGCGGSSVCDDGIGQCGECVDDGHCPAATPHCDRQTDKCVQCLSSSQCPPAKPVCDPSTWTCVP